MEEGALTLEEAVGKVTSFPAQRVGLWDRGILREGTQADIMIFDIESVRERATLKEPRRYPVGIDYVIVNGEIALERGRHTGVLAGKVLKAR